MDQISTEQKYLNTLLAIKSLVDGGVFDLTDSPKSLVSNLKRLLDEAEILPLGGQE